MLKINTFCLDSIWVFACNFGLFYLPNGSIQTSVTRWQHYFFHLSQFTTTKSSLNGSMGFKIAETAPSSFFSNKFVVAKLQPNCRKNSLFLFDPNNKFDNFFAFRDTFAKCDQTVGANIAQRWQKVTNCDR